MPLARLWQRGIRRLQRGEQIAMNLPDEMMDGSRVQRVIVKSRRCLIFGASLSPAIDREQLLLLTII